VGNCEVTRVGKRPKPRTFPPSLFKFCVHFFDPLIGGLLAQGMNPGATLAFLIAGPTTTLPALAAAWGITTRRVFTLYVGFSFLLRLYRIKSYPSPPSCILVKRYGTL